MPSIRRDELAAVLGVDTDYYADLERGLLETPIPAELEDRIARALHLEGEYRQELAKRLRDVYEVSPDAPAASAQATGRHRASAATDSASPGLDASPGSAPEQGAVAASAPVTAIPEQPAQATRDIGYGTVPATSQSPVVPAVSAEAPAGTSTDAPAQAEAPFSFSLSSRTQPTGPQAVWTPATGVQAAGNHGSHLPGSRPTPSTQTGSVPEQPAPASALSRIGSPPGSSPASA
ncbi:hypothetical protein IR146_05270, partial [Actinomyces bowdenii]|nr:hypothetical protein [Actinomyces bowdenii]NYS68929.1 hypothetical protein [Actinomyces bowdenii]